MVLPVTIIGGGLAGLALGIALRRADIPIQLHEAASYPRHRVCGEFLSGRGLAFLHELGLMDKLFKAGAQTATTVSFHTATSSSKIHPLPSPALSLSRYRLDHLLADEFRRAGGELHVNHRWVGAFSSPGIIRATGRRPESRKGEHVVGLKIHVRNLDLLSDLEMHFSSNAYFGLCRIEDDQVNICGLFRIHDKSTGLARERWHLFSQYASASLRERLQVARFNEHSFSTVAALPLAKRPSLSDAEWSLGDAISMIPPLTGNGMSLALESAQLSLSPLIQYAQGKLDWPEALQVVNQNCRSQFTSRLRWAGSLHSLLFSSVVQSLLLTGVDAVPVLLPFLFQKTRA